VPLVPQRSGANFLLSAASPECVAEESLADNQSIRINRSEECKCQSNLILGSISVCCMIEWPSFQMWNTVYSCFTKMVCYLYLLNQEQSFMKSSKVTQ
jgi:hypothetical protein